MPRLAPCTIFLLVGTAPITAQVRFDARLGVMASTKLVADSLGTEPLTLRQNLAPTIALALDTRLNPRNRVGITAGVSRSNLVLRAPSGERALLVLTTWTPTVVLTHELTPSLAASVAAGLILYDPDVRLGTVFSDNAPARPLAGVGLHLRRVVSAHAAVGVDLTYDVHGFMTRSLANRGFVGQWAVHRVTLGVTLGHRDDAPQP